MFNECRHIKAGGARCHAAALRGMQHCYFHATLRRLANSKNQPPNEPLQIPVLEDTKSIQIALTQVISALGASRIDQRRAGLLLYAIQIAVQINSRPPAEKPTDMVRSVCCENDGDVLAPEHSVCEPPQDCATCRRQNTCENYQEPEEEEEDSEEDDEENADDDDEDDDEEDEDEDEEVDDDEDEDEDEENDDDEEEDETDEEDDEFDDDLADEDDDDDETADDEADSA
jgi:hypothetical protein